MIRSILLSELTGITHGFGTAGVELAQYVDGAWYPRTHQVHENTVHVLDGDRRDDILNGDAFVTAETDVVCFVRTADCVPILVADPVRRVVGAIHAGWRGTEQDVAGATIAAMAKRFGCGPRDIRAAIGPAICGACYDTDLIAANWQLLRRAGVCDDCIEDLGLCTSCGSAELASYRRTRTDIRQVSFIMMPFRRQ